MPLAAFPCVDPMFPPRAVLFAAAAPPAPAAALIFTLMPDHVTQTRFELAPASLKGWGPIRLVYCASSEIEIPSCLIQSAGFLPQPMVEAPINPVKPSTLDLMPKFHQIFDPFIQDRSHDLPVFHVSPAGVEPAISRLRTWRVTTHTPRADAPHVARGSTWPAATSPLVQQRFPVFIPLRSKVFSSA